MNAASGTSETPTTVVVGGGAAATTPVASRWNPTKEQINILENLYKQGLRTPTADQIQEITTRLQTYGHIEGKNVFYWFQNHKARQRQKEKQDHLSLFRQYNHHHRHHLHHPFIPLSPPPNVVYEQCYIPQSNLGFYVQPPQAVSPTTTTATATATGGIFKTPVQLPENAVEVAGGSDCSHRQETLDLFPMHPTGVLQEPVDTAGNGTGCVASRACTSALTGGTVDRVYFDFFC